MSSYISDEQEAQVLENFEAACEAAGLKFDQGLKFHLTMVKKKRAAKAARAVTEGAEDQIDEALRNGALNADSDVSIPDQLKKYNIPVTAGNIGLWGWKYRLAITQQKRGDDESVA